MSKRAPLVLAAVLALLTLSAAARTLSADRIYTVRSGDTLWDLSEEFLGSPWLWPLIWQANPELVEHPHWIYPGEELYIPPNVPPDLPDQIRVRIRDEEPIVTLSKEDLVELWRRLLEYGGEVVPDIDELPELAHIVAAVGPERTMFALYDQLYVSGGDEDGFYPGAQFLVYRDRGRVVIPGTRIDVGNLIQNVGIIEIDEVHDDVSRATVIASFEALHKGDGLRFREDVDEQFLDFRTAVPAREWESEDERYDQRGYVCRERDDRFYAADGHIVYVDWGRDMDLRPGSRLVVWREGRDVEDPGELGTITLPDEQIATLGVLKVTQSTATCLVLASTTRIEIGDYVD
ncbi:MAG: LysM peptidoglycan-binding domain-containing protein, partial [Candidatus Coatesbacteria bacterium]|nr:LysM peptidoglycan-binding domain-containing protein [Candidatus Coatesbacteria bacterium]